MKVVINTCSGRESMLRALLTELPHAIINFDDFPKEQAFPYKSTAFLNFKRAFAIAGTGDLLLLEDDIVLTKDFLSKVEKVKKEHAGYVLQFYSMRKKDIEVGTRIEQGKTYMMCQCTYYPEGIASEIFSFSKNWYNAKYTHAPTDPFIAEFLHHKKMNYVIVVPNLVQHIGHKSMINAKRTSRRESKTFEP